MSGQKRLQTIGRQKALTAKRIVTGPNTYVLVPVQPRPDIIPRQTWDGLAAINDFLTASLRYDWDKARAMDHPGYSGRHQPPAVTLRSGSGVCQDFAALFEAIAMQRGFQVRSMRSAQLDHSWNEVHIVGRWWIIDVTWNAADIFTGGADIPSKVKNDPDFRRRYFLTTVEREEVLQRAGLLQQTHRANDVESINYAKSREAYTIIDKLKPILARRSKLLDKRNDASRSHSLAIRQYNTLVARHNAETRAAVRQRIKPQLTKMKQEIDRLRGAVAADDRQIDRWGVEIEDLYRRFLTIAEAHPITVSFTMGPQTK